MSKYDKLWEWIKSNKTTSFDLSFDEVLDILGFPINHSFIHSYVIKKS